MPVYEFHARPAPKHQIPKIKPHVLPTMCTKTKKLKKNQLDKVLTFNEVIIIAQIMTF